MEIVKTNATWLRPVMLNHALLAKRVQPLSWIILAAGLLMFSFVVYQVQQINSQLNVLELKSKALSQTQSPVSFKRNATKLQQAKLEELKVAASAVEALNLRWEALFNTLENINTSQIRLVSLEPNARQHRLRITAESSSADSMLEYVGLLSKQPMLKAVVLQTHEQHEDGRPMPFSFVVEAVWTT